MTRRAQMDADVALIRRAALLMRERATTAPVPVGGPWEAEFSDVIRTDVPPSAVGYLIAECATPPEAKHVASWHPAVALAVAAWLGQMADHIEAWAEGAPTCDVGGPGDETCTDAALAVARAYLGASA